jgi:hypothetical protein
MKLSEFNKKFSGVLEIELTKKPKQISKYLLNVSASPNAKIKSIRFRPEIFENDDLVKPTKKDLANIVIKKSVITIKSDGGTAAFDAPNGEYFTAGDLIKVIEKTERKTRKNIEWFGGIDVHHIFFEGLVNFGKYYAIHWGS